MNFLIMGQVASALLQAAELGFRYVPAIVSDLRLAYEMATKDTDLTDDEQSIARAAVQSAHAALQAQIAKDVAEDEAD